MNDPEKIKQGVLKTGFPLEFQVGKAFQRHGWSTINSKYYVDDVQGTAREIDVIAYRVSPDSDAEICTAIIVSCKKSDDKSWSLIAQDKNERDPNMNWFPLHSWTNQKVLRYVLEKTDWQRTYLADAKSHAFYGDIIHPDHQIFAFQELDSASGKPKNDRNVFLSIQSLMQAQGYEVDSRERAKLAYTRVMNLNLLSVVQSDLLLCKLKEDFLGDVEVDVSETTAEKYISSYIINQQEVTARINFVRFDALDRLITRYDEMHKFNVKFFKSRIKEYYDDPFVSSAAANVFSDVFTRRIRTRVNHALRRAGERTIDDDIFTVWKPKNSQTVTIGLPVFEEDAIDQLNLDTDLTKNVREAFRAIYRYEGPFQFDADIPF